MKTSAPWPIERERLVAGGNKEKIGAHMKRCRNVENGLIRPAVWQLSLAIGIAGWVATINFSGRAEKLAEVALSEKGAGFDAKAFLTKTPAVYRIVFQEMNLLDASAPTPSPIYEAGYSEQSFYLRELSTNSILTSEALQPAVSSRVFVGASGQTYWQVTSSDEVVTSKVPSGRNLSDNPTAAHVRNLRTILEHVLNLGVVTMEQGSAIFDGDKFIANYGGGGLLVGSGTFKTKDGHSIPVTNPRLFGELLRDSGRVTGMRIAQGLPSGPAYYLQFGWSGKLLPYMFPNTIRKIHKLSSGDVVTGEIEILLLEVEDVGRRAPAITIGNLGRKVIEMVHTNDSTYVVDANRGLQPLPSPVAHIPGVATPFKVSTVQKGFLLGFLALTCVMGVLIVIFQKAKKP